MSQAGEVREARPRRSVTPMTRRQLATIIVSLTVGALVFGVLAWWSFPLAFARNSPDVPIRIAAVLTQSPTVDFKAHVEGWELSEKSATTSYVNVTRSGTQCAFGWTQEQFNFDNGDFGSDLDATVSIYTSMNIPVSDYTDVVVVPLQDGRQMELLLNSTTTSDADDGSGQQILTAMRAFKETGDVLMFNLACESTGEMDVPLLQSTLENVTITLQ